MTEYERKSLQLLAVIASGINLQLEVSAPPLFMSTVAREQHATALRKWQETLQSALAPSNEGE